MTATLPPLPPFTPPETGWDNSLLIYTADQLRAYGAACAAAEREACAALCEERAKFWTDRPIPLAGYAAEIDACATAIRARKDTE